MPRKIVEPEPLDEDESLGNLSKTQLKNAMLELQDLGAALLTLPDATLATLPMDDLLRNALRDLRRLTNHGAHKRQLQFVGKLMRNENVAPYRQALADMQAGQARNIRALKDIEQWREKLLAGDTALAEWAATHPAADTPPFRALVRNARREREQSLATAERTHSKPANGRFYRELFKVLRETLLAPT